MGRIVLIRHNDEPDDDRVVAYFRARDLEPEIRKPFWGEALGKVDGSVAASVVYGGPFNVFEEDRHAFLSDENRWIEACISKGVPLLGICQGAQSIARVLGAHVGPKTDGTHEFGYYEIEATPEGLGMFPPKLVVTQAHSHEFQLPAGAQNLAFSNLFAQQAFSYGPSTYALQFHAEVTPNGFRRWQDSAWAPYGKPGVQSRAEQDRLMSQHDADQHRWFMGFLDAFFGPAVART